VGIFSYCALPEDKWLLIDLLNNTTQSRVLVTLLLPQEKNSAISGEFFLES